MALLAAYGGSKAGVELELQLPAYTTATATKDPSHVCDLYHSSHQLRILSPLRGQGSNPITSWILVKFVTTEPQWELPRVYFFNKKRVHVPTR